MGCIFGKIFSFYELLFEADGQKNLTDANECGTLVDEKSNCVTDTGNESNDSEEENDQPNSSETKQNDRSLKHTYFHILPCSVCKSHCCSCEHNKQLEECNDFDLINSSEYELDNFKEIINANHVDDFEDLLSQCPAEVVMKILGYLSCYDLVHRVSPVSKTWHCMAFNPSLWSVLNLRSYVVNDAVINKLSQLCKFVRHIDMTASKVDDLTDDGLVALASSCPNLTKFYAPRYGSHLTDTGFIAFAENCPNLRTYTLDCLDITDRTLTSISLNLHELEYLSICQVLTITNEGVADIIRSCRKLEILHVNINSRINEKSLEGIPDSSFSLRKLEFMMCRLDPVCVPIIGKLKNLELLNLTQCTQLTTKLLTPVVFGCRKLTSLSLNLNEKIDDESIEVIFKYLQELKTINLVSTSITDAGLDIMANKGKKLMNIDLGYTIVTGDGARKVSEFCPCLVNLGLMTCKQLLESVVDELVVEYPHIRYSTYKQEALRLIHMGELKKAKIVS